MIGAVEALGSRDVVFFADFLYDSDETVAAYAARAIERITKQDFGFPQCGKNGGPCNYGYGIENAQRWWNSHKADWKE